MVFEHPKMRGIIQVERITFFCFLVQRIGQEQASCKGQGRCYKSCFNEFSAFHDAIAGIDKFVGKTGNFEVFNTISGMTVNVGAGQKAVSNALGQLIPAPAQPGDYPEDPEGDVPDQQQEDSQEPEEPQQDQQHDTQNQRLYEP